ncbi:MULTISPECIES: MBL fold metallo-hydrolase [unclassified Haladaptatus]|uniref:MBL fold metallo-hydrolase n=1 Tax=unclassified Haladaptatus TaxID=2622732 RepID=UPI0023E78781|nr:MULTISPECIES: MBL fold metallo-hydrolase [unclassified Haladaptatus]
MSLPAAVHDIALSVPFGDRDIQIHPVAIETDHGLILVDAAVPDAVGDIDAQLGEFDYSVEDIAIVLLTHHDADHIAGLAQVVERSRALVCAHRDEAPYIEGRKDPVKGNWVPDPVSVDIELVDGVTFRTDAGPMRVVATPGHSPGHCSLYFPTARTLVAGDALNVGDGLVGPKPEFTPDMDGAIESVAKLARLDVATTHCYHGGTVDEGTSRIKRIRDELQ